MDKLAALWTTLKSPPFLNVYTSWHFTVFRLLLGIYGCLYSLILIKTPLPHFPSLLVILFLCSHLLILIGYHRRVAAIISCILWMFYVSQDLTQLTMGTLALISIYIFCITSPKGEPLSSKQTSSWTLPHSTHTVLWLSYGLFYSGIGISLLLDSRWTRGLILLENLSHFTQCSPFLNNILVDSPNLILTLIAYGSAIVLTTTFLAIFFSQFQIYIWIMTLSISLLCLSSTLSFIPAIILYHLILIHCTWFRPKQEKHERVIAYDGICGLCNHFVQLILSIDILNHFTFIPLQSPDLEPLLAKNKITKNSILFIENEHIYEKSTAVLKILSYCGNIWRFSAMFYLIPLPIRDSIYSLIAKNRYKIFGQLDSCQYYKK
ncbi:hypothetical protein DID78_05765 [Candidatus Marinamargulisbacteria bacterium SCGC AG-343-D04]|nr:hypothetical protein DID78_05765 [Candidatus Marinamargulisbacteria bacterium SCGC AG-343-D04]